jgi:cysteinyl-tRNA synthetase
VTSPRVKADGGARLVLCYLSVGEAETYRFYWRSEWETAPPDWHLGENPQWPDNYAVRYWDPDWQGIVFAYLERILDAGFDGVYLDRVDAYETFKQ